MRVLLVVPSASPEGGGVAEAVRQLATAFAHRSDVSVEIATTRGRRAKDFAGWPDVPRYAFRYFGPARYRFSPGLLWHVLRSRADLVHLHALWSFPCLAVLLWSILWRRPFVVSPHGMLEPWILARSPRLKALVSALYQNALLRRAAALQALTRKEAGDIRAFAGRSDAVVVPNHVEAVAAPAGRPNWWRPDLEGRTIYLFLGRIHEKKGALELCDAWDRLCTEDPAFAERSALVFCGWIDGLAGFEDRLAALAARHPNILFAGPQYRDDKACSLAAADFLVLPSKSEGLPMTVLEAWSAARPVLMTDACNLPEGFAVGAALRIGASVEEVAQGFLLADTMGADDRRDMGEAGRALVIARYSEQAVIGSVLALYRRCLARRRRPVLAIVGAGRRDVQP